jgi:CO/xanthine dehydrogenase Mo-binding subunit
MALAMIATIPPRGHVAEASASLEAGGGYTLRVGTAEFGNGTTTVHTQIAATVLGTEPERITVHQSDTDAVGYDTGAFGSAGSVVAGRAVHAAATELRRQILDRAAALTGVTGGQLGVQCGQLLVKLTEIAPLTRADRRPAGPLRREADERVALQPRGTRAGQRDPGRNRAAPPPTTDVTRPPLAASRTALTHWTIPGSWYV